MKSLPWKFWKKRSSRRLGTILMILFMAISSQFVSLWFLPFFRDLVEVRPVTWEDHFLTSSKNAIPRIMIFTYRTNLLKNPPESSSLLFLENVVRTIRMYAQEWKKRGERVYVWFLDDEECLQVIRLVEPELVFYYKNETRGDYKGDICRGVALYLTGGYYFDVDMEAIVPVQIPEKATISVASSENGYFNSYLVAAPQCPVIRDYLRILLHYYRRQHYPERQQELKSFYKRIPPAQSAIDLMVEKGLIGVWALEGAVVYHKSIPSNNVTFHVLKETNLQDPQIQRQFYPRVQFQKDAEGGCCNYVIEDPEKRQAYFFARFIGAKYTCDHIHAHRRFNHSNISPNRLTQSWLHKALVSSSVQMIELPTILR